MRTVIRLKILLVMMILIFTFAVLGETFSAEEAYRRGKYRISLELYEKMLPKSVSPGFILFNIGNCRLKLGDQSKAAASWEQALIEIPEFFPALFNLASLYMKTGDYSGAITKIEKALQKEPKNSSLLIMKAFALRELSMPAEAINTIEKIMTFDSSFEEGFFILAEYAESFHDIPGAIKHLKAYSDRGPRVKEKYYSLGILYEKEGSFNDALFCYRMYRIQSGEKEVGREEKRVLGKMGLTNIIARKNVN